MFKFTSLLAKEIRGYLMYLGGNESLGPLSPGLVILRGLQGRKPVYIPDLHFIYVTSYGLILIMSGTAPSTFSRLI
jgi:hypothetical protein